MALFHCKAFLRSRLASVSPALDLKYLSVMILYKTTLNPVWYLTEEMVVLFFLSNVLTLSNLIQLAGKLQKNLK